MPEKIHESIARFRQAFPGVRKTRYNEYTKSYYASFDDVWHAIQPYLLNEGLYTTHVVQSGWLYVTIHNSDGETLTSDIQLPPSTENPQRFGSALTYYKRYLVCLMLNITEVDQDDDGNSGNPETSPGVQQHQLDVIYGLIKQTGTDKQRLLDYIEHAYGAKQIEDLNYAQAGVIRRMLAQKLSEPADG